MKCPFCKGEWENPELISSLKNLRLKIFIYLLLRDCITIGELETFMEEACNTNSAQFTNRNLEKYSNEIVERLLTGV